MFAMNLVAVWKGLLLGGGLGSAHGVFENTTGFFFLYPCVYVVMTFNICHLNTVLVTCLWYSTCLVSYLHNYLVTATVKL